MSEEEKKAEEGKFPRKRRRRRKKKKKYVRYVRLLEQEQGEAKRNDHFSHSKKYVL
jgi:hypothetical protein